MKRSGSISGGISLVMIFCVLCMTVFAALTMVTAQREHDMARLTAQRAEEANEADRIAAETVAALARGERPQGVTLAGDEASFTVPAGGETVLSVQVKLGADGPEIRQWKTVYNGDWQAEDSLDLWDASDVAAP